MTHRTKLPGKRRAPVQPSGYDSLLSELVSLIEQARRTSARTVNAIMTATYWLIGRRIVEVEQAGERRAEYGEVLLKTLAQDLTMRFGRGYGWRNLFQMRVFYLAYSEILQTPSAEFDIRAIAARFPLPWSAYVRLLSVKNEHAREHWTRPDENPPVGLILCTHKGAAMARYALEGLPNKVMAAEYRTALPDETLIAEELDKTRQLIEIRRSKRLLHEGRKGK